MQPARGSLRVRVWVLIATAGLVAVLAVAFWPVRDFNCAYPNTAAIVPCKQSPIGVVLHYQTETAVAVLILLLVAGIGLAIVPGRRRQRR